MLHKANHTRTLSQMIRVILAWLCDNICEIKEGKVDTAPDAFLASFCTVAYEECPLSTKTM
jgi:hypothetical protein